MRYLPFAAFSCFLALGFTHQAPAQDLTKSLTEDWADDWDNNGQDEAPSPWTIDGFIEAGQGHFLQSNAVDSSSSLSEVRARFNLEYNHEKFELKAKTDAAYDNVHHKRDWKARELYLSTSLGPFDLRAGRQVLTWGTGDYLFLNDLFAKDWQSFFAGRDDEYLKAPSDSLRITGYLDSVTADIAWTPNFTPDTYIFGERFSFYSPILDKNIAPAKNFRVQTTKENQLSLRLATQINGVEYSLYGYKGFWSTPVGITANGSAYFPKLTAIGASIRSPLAGGILNSEVSYYASKEDSRGDKPGVPNSQIRFLLGYEAEVAKNFTLGGQYYLEKTQDYSAYMKTHPFQNVRAAEYRHLLTLRLTYSALQQSLKYSLFTFYSPTDQDAYLKPSVSYRYSDDLLLSAGANIFWGNRAHTFFGQHESNTNLWLRARYSY